MASIGNDAGGLKRILFYAPDGSRKTLRLGKCSKRDAESVRGRVESLLSSTMLGNAISRDDATWLASDGKPLRSKLEAVGLVEPPESATPKKGILLNTFLDDFVVRNGSTKKPATRIVWGQVVDMLKLYMPKEIALADVTKGHAKAFLEDLRKRGLASTTIHKRIGFARQFFQDAVDWKIISENPFATIKTVTSSTKSNVEVSRETIETVLSHCDLTWKVIVSLCRFGGLRCPSEVLSLRWVDIDWDAGRMNIPEPKVEHHEGRGVRQCPIFPELRSILDEAWDAAPEGAEFVVNKPAYRAAAMREGGWANANLRTQFQKILGRAGIVPWARLFHSMRASRQTELEREFPLHVVCNWLGNSEAIAKKNYLLVTEGDYAKATAEKPTETRGTKSGTIGSESGTKSGTVSASTERNRNEESPEKQRENVMFPSLSELSFMENNGLEPMTSCMPCKRSPN